MYVDGKEQSRIDDYGNGEAINLGKQKKGDFMFKIGHSYGDPDDMSRQLNGEICEVRIWNVLRSQEEIYRNMYDVDPQTTGLKAYWKFNEGKGNNIAKDLTGNGMMLWLIQLLYGRRGLKYRRKIKSSFWE